MVRLYITASIKCGDRHRPYKYVIISDNVRLDIFRCTRTILTTRRTDVNKSELITKVAEKTGFTKKDSEAAVNAFIASVQEALVGGDKVQLIGFGTFETKERKARQGRNPRKPEETIQIAASTAPVFKAGKALKDAVNKK